MTALANTGELTSPHLARGAGNENEMESLGATVTREGDELGGSSPPQSAQHWAEQGAWALFGGFTVVLQAGGRGDWSLS